MDREYIHHEHYMTVGDLLRFIEKNNIPMDAPVLMQRVTDWFKEYLKNQEINDLKKEFADLRKEVEDMKKLLERAAEYDRQNNEPACEVEEKVALLKRVAELVGVDLKDVFKNK